jgi:hypothetical protein
MPLSNHPERASRCTYRPPIIALYKRHRNKTAQRVGLRRGLVTFFLPLAVPRWSGQRTAKPT